MNKSPWLAKASVGATGATYEIRTVADFFKVPESRRRICLREFDAWMAVKEGVSNLITIAGKGAVTADQFVWHRDVFRWVDDGKATISVEMKPSDPSRDKGETVRPTS
jgi:hypothetical protein